MMNVPPYMRGNRFRETKRLGPSVSEFRSQALPVCPAPCGHPQAWLGQHVSHPPPGMGPREGCRGGLGLTAPVSPCVWARTAHPLPPVMLLTPLTSSPLF